MSCSPIRAILAGLVLIAPLSAYTPPAAAVTALNSYRSYSDLTSAAGSMNIDLYAHNATTWQMPHGGFFKAYAAKYVNAWNGTDARSDQNVNNIELGTIDNNATIQEMRLFAVRYKATTNATYKSEFKAAFQKALGFIVSSQQSKGSWPQMYPARGNYSDMATYNDNAMIRVMVLAKDIVNKLSPFDSDIATDAQRTQLQTALNKAVDFALKSQIYNNNIPTVWCAQHDPSTYKPVAARAYELESKSGSESAGIAWFLMNWPDQTAAVQSSVKGAIAWYKKNRIADLKFSNGTFVASSGASMWYRFYEVNTDDYFFCDRGGVSTKTQDIMTLSDDRRLGYQWAGDYGSKLLAVEASYITAVASVVLSSSSTLSSAVLTSSSATASVSSSSTVLASSSTPDCGGVACTNLLQGELFCNAQGVLESKNAGFTGTGYLNLDNAVGASAGYAIQASTAGTTTLFIRYANGTATTRNAKILVGSQTLVADLAFPTTGNWTTWSTLQVPVTLPLGRDSLVFQSLTADGISNLDWIGWQGTNAAIGTCNAGTTGIQHTRAQSLKLSGRIQKGNLMIQNLPQGTSEIRIRNLYGKVLATHSLKNTNTLSVGSLGKGTLIIEIEQNHKKIGSFIVD